MTAQPVSVPGDWMPSGWRERVAAQQPNYPDAEELAAVQAELRCLPPLVTTWEILASWVFRRRVRARQGA